MYIRLALMPYIHLFLLLFIVSGEQWAFHRKTAANLFNLNRFKGVILDTCTYDIILSILCNTFYFLVLFLVTVNDHCTLVEKILTETAGKSFDIQVFYFGLSIESC